MEKTEEVIEIVKKLVKKLRANPSLWENRSDVRHKSLTVESFSSMSCNHAFDDYPERYDITLMEAHTVRAWFHNNTAKGGNDDSFSYWAGVFADCGLDHDPNYIDPNVIERVRASAPGSIADAGTIRQIAMHGIKTGESLEDRVNPMHAFAGLYPFVQKAYNILPEGLEKKTD